MIAVIIGFMILMLGTMILMALPALLVGIFEALFVLALIATVVWVVIKICKAAYLLLWPFK